MIKNLSYGSQLHFSNNRNTISFGRNGSYNCIGIDTFNYKGEIQLTGITSKGHPASGRICIPKEDIKDFIKILKSIENES